MFGYVRPYRDELRMCDYDTYRAAYCGLCRASAKRFGFRTRFLVNYDMTFLYLVRAGIRPRAKQGKCWCPSKLCGSKRCLIDDAGYAEVAAYNVILCYHKILDQIADGGFFRALGARFLKLLFRRPYRKASKAAPAYSALVRSRLDALHALEKAESPSLDRTADAFAEIVAGCADDLEDEAIRRPARSLLYQVGRYVYLCDALDDLCRDIRKGAYNPLRFRFTPTADGLSAENQAYLQQLMDSSVNLAGAALSLLPIQSGGRLLENIVYLGLPAVFAAVRAGKFQNTSLRIPGKEIKA